VGAVEADVKACICDIDGLIERIKICDFGKSTFLAESKRYHTKNFFLTYLAPELFGPQAHQNGFSPKLDIYQAGIIYYQVFALVPDEQLSFRFRQTKDSKLDNIKEMLQAREHRESWPYFQQIDPIIKQLIETMLSIEANKRPTIETVLERLLAREKEES